MLDIKEVSKHFNPQKGAQLLALDDVSLTIHESELVVFLGPSGCGKTTLLRIIVGLEQPSSGQVLLDGEDITGRGPTGERGIVFQAYSSFPWLTVRKNIEFAVKYKKGVTRTVANNITDELISMTGLVGFQTSYPKELSGGMRQKLAIARTLAAKPRILVMDEPFGSLDALTRTRLQQEFLRLQERNKQTVAFVTHDVDEALLLAHRIFLFTPRPGRILRELNLTQRLPIRDRLSPAFASLREEIYADLSSAIEDSLAKANVQ